MALYFSNLCLAALLSFLQLRRVFGEAYDFNT
jgi:hypothetical protein